MKYQSMWYSIGAALVAMGQIAHAAAPATSLATESSDGVTYLSGGIGLDESQALKQTMRDYPLVLEFYGKTNGANEYLSDVPVRIADAQGKTVLETLSRGPFLLARLPDGRYTIVATYRDHKQRRTIDVSSAGHARAVFIWPKGWTDPGN